jgi:signal transduction histidine kinase
VPGAHPLLYSMLCNLIKNAIEASPEGGSVALSITREDGVRLEIRNRGAVPAEIRPRFFEKYTTAGKPRGVGLGAYSARLIARVHGGDLTLDASDPDATTVIVALPAQGDPAGADGPRGGTRGEPARPGL